MVRIQFSCINSSKYLKWSEFLYRLFKIACLAAICKMSGCITTDILLPLCSELAGSENWKICNVK